MAFMSDNPLASSHTTGPDVASRSAGMHRRAQKAEGAVAAAIIWLGLADQHFHKRENGYEEVRFYLREMRKSLERAGGDWKTAERSLTDNRLLNLKRELLLELDRAKTAWTVDSEHGGGYVRGLQRALFHVQVELGETSQEI